LASVPDFLKGSVVTATTSALTSGPSAPRATSAASSITRSCSRVTTLSISDVAPARRTMAFLGEPEVTSASSKPLERASMATNTPTVPAMPRIATIVLRQRARTLSRL
jgi:hypothetical protein